MANFNPNVPLHGDILRFYVVHKNYENLLESNILNQLYNYTLEMMNLTVNYKDTEWTFANFCKKEGDDKVHYLNLL